MGDLLPICNNMHISFGFCYEQHNKIHFNFNEMLYMLLYHCSKCNCLLFSFSPSGWDNEKKIGILHENLTTVRPEHPFEDFITKPPVRKVKVIADIITKKMLIK